MRPALFRPDERRCWRFRLRSRDTPLSYELARELHAIRRILTRPQDAVPYTLGDLQTVPIRARSPEDFRRFVGLGNTIRLGPKTPDQIVVQVEGLRFLRRNPVHIDAGQNGREMRIDQYGSFFMSLARRRVREIGIGFLYVPAGQQPAPQTVVMHQKNARLKWMKNQGSARDMTGLELIA